LKLRGVNLYSKMGRRLNISPNYRLRATSVGMVTKSLDEYIVTVTHRWEGLVGVCRASVYEVSQLTSGDVNLFLNLDWLLNI